MSNFEPPIMTIKGAKLSFGTNHLFTDVELYINRGDKICLVGRNGSGKSTLLKVIAGDIEADDGEIFIQPGIKISYMPQDPDFRPTKLCATWFFPVWAKTKNIRSSKLTF